MSTDRQHDAGLDQLLREALNADGRVTEGLCPGADVVAAYSDNGLTARERLELEPHLAVCPRCQSVLAVMAGDAIADPPLPPRHVAAWRAWFSVSPTRWIVPAAAVAVAVVLYVAVEPRLVREVIPAPPPASSPIAVPEGTMAKLDDRAVSPAAADLAGGAATGAVTAPAPVPSQGAVSAKAVAPVQAPARRATPFAVPAAPPLSVAEAQAPVAGNRAMVLPAPERMEGMPTKDAAREEVAMQTQERSRRKPVHLIPPRNDSGASLDTLWPQADLIVQARAGSTGNAAAVVYRFEETDTTYVHPMVPTRFDIAEVFKRNDGIPPVPTLALWQLGGEAEEAAEIFRVPDDQWVRFTPGMEYVLFAVLRQDMAQTERVELLAGPKGIYRLDGEQVFVGTSPDPEPNLSRGQLLARLRQLAGTAKR